MIYLTCSHKLTERRFTVPHVAKQRRQELVRATQTDRASAVVSAIISDMARSTDDPGKNCHV